MDGQAGHPIQFHPNLELLKSLHALLLCVRLTDLTMMNLVLGPGRVKPKTSPIRGIDILVSRVYYAPLPVREEKRNALRVAQHGRLCQRDVRH